MKLKPGFFKAFAILTLAAAASAANPLLLVLNKEEATLAFIDPASGKVLARVPTGESPHEIAVSSAGKLAFISNYGSRTPGSTISVTDIPARKELRRVDLSPMRNRTASSPLDAHHGESGCQPYRHREYRLGFHHCDRSLSRPPEME